MLHATTTDANPNAVSQSRQFSTALPGLSLVMLSSGNPSSNAIRFQLVRSIEWNDPLYLHDNAPAIIGQPIVDPGGYFDPAGGSPQVVLPKAVYCPAPVFDPATRTGTIIPVNRDNPNNPEDDLVVAYYRRGTLLFDPVTGVNVPNNIFWPSKPVRFTPVWAAAAPHLIIASQQGTGSIDPVQFVDWQLYSQNNVTQADSTRTTSMRCGVRWRKRSRVRVARRSRDAEHVGALRADSLSRSDLRSGVADESLESRGGGSAVFLSLSGSRRAANSSAVSNKRPRGRPGKCRCIRSLLARSQVVLLGAGGRG
jgi:hypothetical protein